MKSKEKFSSRVIKNLCIFGVVFSLSLMMLKYAENNNIKNHKPYTFVTQGILSMIDKAAGSLTSDAAPQVFASNDPRDVPTNINVLGEWNENFGYNNCGVPLGTGFCAPQNLVPYFREAGVYDPDLLADKFSRICRRESGSDPSAFNNAGFVNGSVDVSGGFFQMNLLAHCSTAFVDAHGNTGLNFNAYDLPVRVVDGEKLKQCLLPLVIDDEVMREVNSFLPPGTSPLKLDDPNVASEKADLQIRAMIDLYKRDGLRPWSMGSRGCSIR